jgi:hypothetical protein
MRRLSKKEDEVACKGLALVIIGGAIVLIVNCGWMGVPYSLILAGVVQVIAAFIPCDESEEP